MREKVLTIYGVAILLGILTGFFGSLFQLAISACDHLLETILVWARQHHFPAFALSGVFTMLMVLVAWIMVIKIAPEAAGSGVQEIEGCLLHERPIFWKRLLPVKFIGGVLAISSKMVLGREGPTIQIGGNLGDMLGNLFNFSRKRRDILVTAGSAAGLTVAFNAPLAGVLFILEEMRKQFYFSFTNFKTIAICCVVAAMVLHLMIGSRAVIPMAIFEQPELESLWLFFVFGIITGFVGLLFNITLMKWLYCIDKTRLSIRFSFVLATGLLIGSIAWYYPSLVGGGYEIIQKSLVMKPALMSMTILLIIRFILSILCYSTGIPGGIFAPLLAMGTLLGLAASQLFTWLAMDMNIPPGMFAVAGMGALFSASVRAPITGIVLVVEMTQNYALILPLMVSCLTSTTIMQLAGNSPIYTQLLNRTLKRSTPRARHQGQQDSSLIQHT